MFDPSRPPPVWKGEHKWPLSANDGVTSLALLPNGELVAAGATASQDGGAASVRRQRRWLVGPLQVLGAGGSPAPLD